MKKYTYSFSKTELAYQLDAGLFDAGNYTFEAKFEGTSNEIKKGNTFSHVFPFINLYTILYFLLYLPSERSFYKQGKYSAFAESLKSTMDVHTSYDIFNMLNYLMVELDHIKKEQSKEMSLITQLLRQRPLDNLMP